MGTWYDRLTGYKGKLAERANLDDLQQIRDIHRAYIEAGARLIRTNTFAVNSMFFSADEIEVVLKAAWENACQAVSDSGRAAPYPACGMPLPAGCAAAIPQYAAAAGYAALFLPEGLLRSAIRTAEAALLPSNETVGS